MKLVMGPLYLLILVIALNLRGSCFLKCCLRTVICLVMGLPSTDPKTWKGLKTIWCAPCKHVWQNRFHVKARTLCCFLHMSKFWTVHGGWMDDLESSSKTCFRNVTWGSIKMWSSKVWPAFVALMVKGWLNLTCVLQKPCLPDKSTTGRKLAVCNRCGLAVLDTLKHACSTSEATMD
jgi:hypothetical protein